jgi:hypothetical protein
LYNVVVTHEKEVLSVSDGFYASINDKTSVKYDRFVDLLKQNKIGENISYKIFVSNADGDSVELDMSSFYVVADGGYIDIPQIICGFGYSRG